MAGKSSFSDFPLFRIEQEKVFLRWFLIGEAIFFGFFLILMISSEEIFRLGILVLKENLILILINFLLMFLIFFSLLKNLWIWLMKYFLLIFVLLIIGSWFYNTDPQYTKPLLAALPAFLIILANSFYDIKILLFVALSTILFWGLLLFYYSKIGALPSVYEIYLICVFLFMMIGTSFPLVLRTKRIFSELLKTKKELEESKTILEIKVRARTKELEELTKKLDEQVRNRTKELQEKVEELEKFQKLTVGRELKMIELKEENKKLKEKIESLKKGYEPKPKEKS